jgi:2-C-methyl-D-erythritol 2,4-cyclodiphosphate synthase
MFKIGFGYDIHRLVPGRKLVLGGVRIPSKKGLLGHSDADVVLHAVADALLGATGMGDIGEHFPNTDKKYKNILSLLLLKKVAAMLENAAYRVANIDVMLLMESPKIGPFKIRMRQAIARALDISVAQVSIKATTHEGVGAVGRGEAAAAYAVVLIQNSKHGIRSTKRF